MVSIFFLNFVNFGKIVMSVTKEDVINASSKVQMCGADSEAAIHAMKELFEMEQLEENTPR